VSPSKGCNHLQAGVHTKTLQRSFSYPKNRFFPRQRKKKKEKKEKERKLHKERKRKKRKKKKENSTLFPLRKRDLLHLLFLSFSSLSFLFFEVFLLLKKAMDLASDWIDFGNHPIEGNPLNSF
jgi:hypothetical protein